MLISTSCWVSARDWPFTTFVLSAPEIALSEVDTEAEIIPFTISCLAATPTLTAFAAFTSMLLSLSLLLPMIAFLSVKNRLTASVPPTELPPPEPVIDTAKLRMSVKLSALTPTDPPVVSIRASSVIRASTSVSITFTPSAPDSARSFVDIPPAAINVRVD